MNKKNCRLCLQTTSENYQVEDILKTNFNLNLDISKDTVACMECMNNLQVFLTLKSACVDIREKSLNFTELQNNVSVNPVDTEKNTDNLKSVGEPRDEIRCSFCTSTGQQRLISLYESKENMFMVDMLEKHIPELNMCNTEELLTCETCLNKMQTVSNFLTNLLYVEEKISKYMEIEQVDFKGQIELQDVQQFKIEPTLKCEGDSCQINELEQTYEQIQENYPMKVETEVGYKIEVDKLESAVEMKPVDIKCEQGIWDSFQESTTDVKLDNYPLETPMYKCGLCPFESKFSSSVKRHVLTHQDSAGMVVYNSETCTYETIHTSHVYNHILIDKKMFKCELCAYKSKRKSCLTKHMLKHENPSEVKIFRCEICTFETYYRSNFNEHKLVHKSPSELTMFKCKTCAYEVKRKRDLKRHMLTHEKPSEIAMFKCGLCTFEARRGRDLEKHLLKHENSSQVTQKMYHCEDCSFETCYKYNLVEHNLTHKSPSEIEMFKCELCTFEVKRKRDLNRHMLTHKDPSEITMYKCELCTYKAKQKRDLNRHVLTHEDPSRVTKFKCEVCEFETIRKKALKRHMLSHKNLLEGTMYNCDICSFKTIYKYNLTGHKLIHKSPSEITTFKCDLCKFETKRKCTLRGHMLLHKDLSQVVMFKCEMCTFKTKHKLSLARHISNHSNSLGNNNVQV